MLNEQPPGERRPHPLERRPAAPAPPPAPEGEPPRRRVMLHIPSVSPTITHAIIGVNVAVFVVRALSPALDGQLLEWGANNPIAVLRSGEYHRLLTSMFLHASIYGARGQFVLANSLHLLFNMYVLYAVGTQLERLFSHLRFALVYLLGGLGGSVLSAVLGSPNAYSVGASGAVFAVIGAEFVYLFQHRRLLGAAAQVQMRSLLLWIAINLAFGFFTQVAGSAFRIDNWGHIGGLVGGAALAWFIAPYYLPRRHPENPDALIADDINPLRRRYWAVSLYAAALLLILIVASRAVSL